MDSPATGFTSPTLVGWAYLPVSIHEGVRPLDQENESVGVIDYLAQYCVRDLYSELMDTELVLVSPDRTSLVPLIKEHEQAVRTEKTAECARVFQPFIVKVSNPYDVLVSAVAPIRLERASGWNHRGNSP